MSIKPRRRVLKGLGVALPAAWARPVIETVVLPVHAQTSAPVTNISCSAPEGCYITGGFSFPWPGGAGPYSDLPFYDSDDCTGEFGTNTGAVVVAANEEEAQDALGSAVPPSEIPTTPAPPGGCSFFGIG